MIKQTILIFAALVLVFTQIADHKISGDTSNFSEVTSVYTDAWYSGYLTLDANTKVHYWYFPVYNNLSGAPLLVTINQGPGCSSTALNSLLGFGPFVFNEDESKFEQNDYSWNLNAHLLFIDAPGIGYSYGSATSYSDSVLVQYYYDTIQVFLQNYSSLKTANVYLHGIGYAGLLVPRLALLIYNTNKSSSTTGIPVQLAGFIVGNPVTTKNEIPSINYSFPYNKYTYLRNQGFLNWDLFDEFVAGCGYDSTDFSKASTAKCKSAVSKIEGILVGLNLQDIMADCEYTEDQTLSPPYTCFDHAAAEKFFNKDNVLKALHVNTNFKGTYKVCNKLSNYATPSAILYAYEELILTGLKMWIYSGDQDAEISFSGTWAWMEDLRYDQGLSDLVSYGSWFYQDVLEASEDAFVQNGGSYWKFDGLSFIRFKGCGQDAVRCNPIGSQLMFKNFVLDQDMPLDPYGDF